MGLRTPACVVGPPAAPRLARGAQRARENRTTRRIDSPPRRPPPRAGARLAQRGEATAVLVTTRVGTAIVGNKHDPLRGDDASDGRKSKQKVLLAHSQVDVARRQQPKVSRNELQGPRQLAAGALKRLVHAIGIDTHRLHRSPGYSASRWSGRVN
eukprot:scaffold24832_cov121-Isochrysis_galbana.AAC.1